MRRWRTTGRSVQVESPASPVRDAYDARLDEELKHLDG